MVEPLSAMFVAGLAGWAVSKAGDSATRVVAAKARKLTPKGRLSAVERALEVAVRDGTRSAAQYVYGADSDSRKAQHVVDCLFETRTAAELPLVDGCEMKDLPVAVRAWIAEALYSLPEEENEPAAEGVEQAGEHELLKPLVAGIVHHIRWEATRGAKCLGAYWLEHCMQVPELRREYGEEFAVAFQQRSKARREVRLRAFGVDESFLAPYFDRIKVPSVSAGEVMVLLGDFGSGKSEVAEAWHREQVEKFVANNLTPFPLWLSARSMIGQTLEDLLERQIGSSWRKGRGAAITIDGLDETDPATAHGLLDDARILTRTYSNIKVLLTARHGIVTPLPNEKVTVALLTEDEALQLVELVSGKPYGTWKWTADMRATVTRPVFALSAGIMLRRDEAPRGEADLIRGLVEDALAKGTEHSAITSRETQLVLIKLAVALTRTGTDGLLFSERQIARSSRLIAHSSTDSVWFSLPIFQQWFAAQALLIGPISK